MRTLKIEELECVAGGHECSASNNYGGITDGSSVGSDLIAIYEGLVAATSHVIERVANAF